jgi:hypothetical protein
MSLPITYFQHLSSLSIQTKGDFFHDINDRKPDFDLYVL